jgi:hypothetical protein
MFNSSNKSDRHRKEGVLFIVGCLFVFCGTLMAFGPVAAGIMIIVLGCIVAAGTVWSSILKDKEESANDPA